MPPPIVSPSKDVWATLPGEIRNRIYELLIPTDINIDIKKRKRRPNTSTYWSRVEGWIPPTDKRARWTEPALLRVNKQIRAEAGGLYYSNNHFTLWARSEELHKALDFLLCKSRDDGVDITVSFTVKMVSACWSEIEHWLQLALIAWHAAGDEAGIDLDRAVDSSRARSVFAVEPLRHVVGLGVRVRRRGGEWDWLKADFIDWARTALAILCKGDRRRRHFAGGIDKMLTDAFGDDAVREISSHGAVWYGR